jgi:hypothetical protein
MTSSTARWSVAVACLYLIVELVVLPLHIPPGRDEAVYLSQVTRSVPATPFVASRARGIVLLVAPFTLAGIPLTAVRMILAMLASAGLLGGLLVWRRPLGGAAPIAGVLITGSWVVLLYGKIVSPNLPTALLAFGAAGAFVRRIEQPSSRWGVAAGLLAGAMALFRPPDAAFFLLGLGVVLPLLPRPRPLKAVLGAAGAVAVGWAAWLVEATIRFDGPLAAFRQGSAAANAKITDNLVQYLALTDGPLMGPQHPVRIPLGGVLWWGGGTLLVAVALIAERGRLAPAVRVATAAGLSLGAEYVFAVSEPNPRFLLPSQVLLAIPAGVGLLVLWRWHRVLAAIAFTGVAVWLIWSGVTAYRFGRELAGRDASERVGVEVRRLAGGRPCVVASSEDWAVVQYVSGCRASDLAPTSAPSLASDVLHGNEVFVASRHPMTELPTTIESRILLPGGVIDIARVGGEPPASTGTTGPQRASPTGTGAGSTP